MNNNNILSKYSIVIGNVLSFYEIKELIGYGSTCKVYRAIHRLSNKQYAIKVSSFKANSDIILNEIEVMKKLNQHKNTIHYYGAYINKTKDTISLIIDYCDCGSLNDIIKVISLSEIEIANIIQNVLAALSYMHNNMLIHRDIKAGNILISSDGSVKLGDFGISCQKGEHNQNKRVGSPYWMSPEVIGRNIYNEKIDIWSLGITCYELVEKEPPYSEYKPFNVMKKIEETPPKGLKDHNEYSKEFNNFVSCCLIVDAHQRPSASDLMNSEFIVNNNTTNEVIINMAKRYMQLKKTTTLSIGQDEIEETEKENTNTNNNCNNDISDSVIINNDIANSSINYNEIIKYGSSYNEMTFKPSQGEISVKDNDNTKETLSPIKSKKPSKSQITEDVDKEIIMNYLETQINDLYKQRDYEVNSVILQFTNKISKLRAALRIFDRYPMMNTIKDYKSIPKPLCYPKVQYN